jgi:signal transduction histidine kinase
MKSLGARLALLLLTAIVLVVITSSFAASLVLRGPRPETTMEPVARQLRLIAEFAEADRAAAMAKGIVLSPKPADGSADDKLSSFLAEALRRTGAPRDVTISHEPGRGDMATASIRLADGSWMLAPLPQFEPPPGGWKILVGWLFLIVAGSTVVSVFAASRIIRPLRLIEDALAQIQPDGMLPTVAETGPGEIKATARALNRLSARVRTATESRMRLVAAAGHDLRTPMTRMRLRAEFITEENERAKWLSDLEELDKIADSAIGLVREEINRDPLERVRLDRVVVGIVGELSGMGLPIRLGTVEKATICAAPLALTRALRNLLINAATHGVSAVADVVQEESTATLRIVDTGPGIPEDRLDQVFEPFFRIDAARQKSFPGAGLGMAIAKEILLRFEGRIEVRNRPAKGLEQLITFHLAPVLADAR